MATACVPAPGLSSLVEPGEWLPGGDTTNTLLLGRNAFLRPAENISPQNEAHFYSGNSFFNQAWVQAPASTTARDGLGPLFNARSCAGCHFQDGRGKPPTGDDPTAFEGLLLRLGTADGSPDPIYGGQLQPFGIDGVPAEATQSATYEVIDGTYEDGTPYELLRPHYELTEFGYGEPSPDLGISPRIAPQMIGLGLLDAIDDARLDELADPDDADGDGVSGERAVGRFGWRAEQPTVRDQVAAAFLGDIGLSSPLLDGSGCTDAQPLCTAASGGGGDPEVQPVQFERVVTYSAMVAVPVRRNWDDPAVLAGKKLFGELGCASCHVARHVTGDSEFEELSNQTIWPYTDLLLHDMGEDLADDFSREWRTPPLWGIGLLPAVNKHQRLLHDGRARGVSEAILWHGGEAQRARDRFLTLSGEERDDLVEFVNSL